MEDMRNAYTILYVKSVGKRSFWRCRLRWEDNIKLNLKEIDVRMSTGFISLRIGYCNAVL
jgi:hypothetical protein